MATKYVTDSKKDSIISYLIKPIKKELNDAKNAINDVMCNILLKYVPKDILIFWEKYPSSVRFLSDISFKLVKDPNNEYNYEHYYFKFFNRVPYNDIIVKKNFSYNTLYNDFICNNEDDKKLYNNTLQSYINIYNKMREIESKLKCALSQFKTYNQLKENYPEAYKILIENVDGEKLPTGNECDNIEEVRAVLSKYNKYK